MSSSSSSTADRWQNDSLHAGTRSLIDMKSTPNLDDFVTYPLLKNAHRLDVEVNEGEALIIPKGWWHTVKSYEDTYFCNFWSQKLLGHVPKVINHNVKFDDSYIDNDKEVSVWNSSTAESMDPFKMTFTKKTFGEFITEKKPNEYLWTTGDGYGSSEDSLSELRNELTDKIEVPEVFEDVVPLFNFGVCSNFHCTTLHYDGEDGLLCVTKGKKQVTLFPPSDTPYLYAEEKEKYKWKNSKNIWCVYDKGPHFKDESKVLEGNNSGSLLYETCKDNDLVLSSISKIVKDCHPFDSENQMAYSVSNVNGEYIWELYNPGVLIGGRQVMSVGDAKKDKFLDSVEIYSKRGENGHNLSEFIDEYFLNKDVFTSENTAINHGFRSYDVYRTSHQGSFHAGKLVFDEKSSFDKNFDKYWKYLNFGDEHYEDCKKYVQKYNCSDYGVHNYINREKDKSELYVLFANISNEDFLSFLKEFNYHQGLIDLYENNTYNICNDVGIKWCLKTKKVTKTKFLGMI